MHIETNRIPPAGARAQKVSCWSGKPVKVVEQGEKSWNR